MARPKPIFNAQLYDRRHLRNIASQLKAVQALYWDAIDTLCNRGERWLDVEPGRELHFEDFPMFNAEADKVVQNLARQLQLTIEQGNEEAWTLSNLKNDTMVKRMGFASHVPPEKLEQWTMPHMEALEQFNARVVAGMNLSERVWNLAQPFKSEMELALEIGIGDGLSAADLSREVRKYLNEPNRLFRRVRDRDGNLRLSKAAAAYHPGRGVYRSSYKNALRMTATENNMAYRTADHKRWKQLDFVTGIEISTSPTNHPEVDICDELKGTYPKDIKFVGWHPWCRCIATAKTADDKQFDNYIDRMLAGEDVDGFHFEGEVTEMPECFTSWVRNNQERIARAKNTPYFISDNVQQVDKILGRNPESDIMGYIDKQLSEAPKNPAVEAHRKQIEDFMAQAVEQSDIAIRMSEQSLLQVIEDEMFKTASDTGTNTFVKAERWKLYMEERAATEKALYGTSGRTTYGYLESKEIGAETTSKQLKRYGEIVVRLRKDAIRTATWTPDDSMAMYRERGMVRRTKAAEWKEGYYRPSDIRHPNASMFADKRSKWIDNMLQTDPKNAREFFNTHGLYSEVQIHGQLGIQAIDSVTLPFSLEGKKYAAWAERAERLREKGIRVYYRSGDKVVEFMPAQPQQTTPRLSIQEIAEQRHAARTAEQIKDITERWRRRQLENLRNAYYTEGIVYKEYATIRELSNLADLGTSEEALQKIERVQASMKTRKKATEAFNKLEQQINAMPESHREMAETLLKQAKKELSDAAFITPEVWERWENFISSVVAEDTAGTAALIPGQPLRRAFKTRAEISQALTDIEGASSSKWFANVKSGKVEILKETNPKNNGSTTRDGRIWLTEGRTNRVRTCLRKIGQGYADLVTKEEADALATLWHEITHNMHVGFDSAGAKMSKSRRFMELANEWVARHTLPDFYERLGVAPKSMPHKEFMKKRTSTGYDGMVTSYDHVIGHMGLDRDAIMNTAKKKLFEAGGYDKLEEGLAQALIDGGLCKADGTLATIDEAKELMRLVEKTSKSDKSPITRWLSSKGFAKRKKKK